MKWSLRSHQSNSDVRTVEVGGLSVDQIERVQRYAERLRRVGAREEAASRFLAQLSKRRSNAQISTDTEAMDLALEAQQWARRQQQ